MANFSQGLRADLATGGEFTLPVGGLAWGLTGGGDPYTNAAVGEPRNRPAMGLQTCDGVHDDDADDDDDEDDDDDNDE